MNQEIDKYYNMTDDEREYVVEELKWREHVKGFLHTINSRITEWYKQGQQDWEEYEKYHAACKYVKWYREKHYEETQ